MITSLARYAMAAAVGLGGAGAVTAASPAQAAGFSAAYTCDVPMLGSRPVSLDGWMSSPGEAPTGAPAGFQLHMSGFRLQAPVQIDSWSAAARVDVGGAESASFEVTGSGGYTPAGVPLSGDLTGGWTPTVEGTHVLSVGAITVTVRTAAAGDVTVRCVANEPRPAAGALTVLPAYQPGWDESAAPPYGVVVAPPYGTGGPYYGGSGHGGWNHGGWDHGGHHGGHDGGHHGGRGHSPHGHR
jgi:hypothetical protein